MMPSGLGFNNLGSQGSPTRMEMGQGGMSSNTAAEIPVPSTPPGADEVGGVTFGMQGNATALGVGNLVGNVGNLVGAGNLANAGGLIGAGNLASAGSFGPAGNLSGMPSSGSCPYSSMSPMFSGPCNPQGNVQPGFYGCGPHAPMNSGGICSGSRGSMPSGGMTQASKLQQIAELVGSLDANQTRTLQQMLGERLTSQVRMNPEFFGDIPRNSGEPFVPDQNRDVLGGYGYGNFGGKGAALDAFSKSEKWLTPAPVPAVETWRSRDLEILGWSEFATQLVAWAAQGSEEFANEISHAIRWHSPIVWDSLSRPQKNRSTRLFSILKAAFSTHPRTSMIISAFSEGLNVYGNSQSFSMLTEGEMKSNGYELVRQLTQEFSLRSRAEALSLRTSLAAKSFTLAASETTVGTVVSDTIRKLDYECSRYGRLVSTLPSHVDSTGLMLPEADMLMILLRSLPPTVRDYCLHHSGGETFQDYKQTAKRWEEQQRLFQEVYGNQGKKVHQLTEESKSGVEWYSLEDPSNESELNAVSGDKCSRCGSKKHKTDSCTVDMSKVKCFSCGGSGHIGANCPEKRKGASNQVNQGGKWSKGKAEGKGKGGKSGKGKEASKGGKSSGGKGKKGYGKKGKLNETIETDPVDMWYEEGDWWFDADWNTWVTASVQEGWHENEFGEDWKYDSAQADGTAELSGTNSLIISMMQGVADEEETGLFLEGSGSDGSCLTLGSTCSVPQPFLEGSGSEQGSQKGCKFFCSCVSCEKVSKEFSKAWSTHRMRVNEKKSKGAFVCKENLISKEEVVCKDDLISVSSVSCFEKFCGLKAPTGLCSGFVSNSEALVSQFHGKMTIFKTRCSTFLNHPETCSPFSQFVRYSSVVMPLLSQMSMDDASWWLLDSGASATVLAERFAKCYGVPKEFSDNYHGDQFKAANGTAVNMKGKAEVGVKIVMVDEWGTQRSQRSAQLKAMIGDIQHNIISTTSLCKAGWEFWQGDTWFELRNRNTGEVASEVGYFAGCPWIRLQTCHDAKTVSFVGVDSNEKAQLAPLTRAAEADLLRHRLQGHTPYDPRCVECARGMTTFAHRRRREGALECELQADFAYLSTRGELTDVEVDNCFKVLVLAEMASNGVAYVLVKGDLASTRNEIAKWLEHLGMSSERSSVILHTDSEHAVSHLVSRVSSRFNFAVRRASPQQHRSVGAAERCVRRLKESMAVLRSDMNQHGVDIPFTEDSLHHVLTYLSLSHNHFGKAPASEFSPLECIAERRLSKPHTSLYGSVVLAEIPQSLLARSPNESRNIEAMYLHAGLGTGPVVQGFVREEGQMRLKRFVARNLKPIFPIAWKKELAGEMLVQIDSPVAPQPLQDSGVVPEVGDGGRDPGSGSGRILDDGPGRGSPSPDFVEYPDGAPPEVVREMKEPETMEVDLKRGSVKRGQTETPVVSNRPMTMRRQGPISAPTPVGSPGSEAEGFGKTQGCDACQSGMVAPGIRHSAKCKRRLEEFKRQAAGGSRTALDAAVSEEERLERERSVVVVDPEASETLPERAAPPVADMEVELDPSLTDSAPPESHVEYDRRFKRPADVPTEQLEREMNEETEGRMDALETGWYWMATGQPVLGSVSWSLDGPCLSIPATSPEMFYGNISSIQFNSGGDHQSKTMELGGATVLLWRPDEIIDDTTLANLDPKLGFLGMEEEIRNLNSCSTGECMTEAQVQNLKQKYPNARVITCRWVSAYKSEERVRCRIVAKDIKRGSSARSLGFSSPTPSIEGLHCILTLAANRGYLFRSLDVAHAFMHSPMPRDEHVILRLPLSVSFENGDPVFLYLFRSLNGLRNASMHWLSLLSKTIQQIGLWSDEVEPCIYGGQVRVKNKDLGCAMLVAYVDDVLVAGENETVVNAIEQEIGKVVPVKCTGSVLTGEHGGGSLTFIGRKILRAPGHQQVLLSVDDKYLQPAFDDFGVTAGSKHVPDVAAHLEKTINDKDGSQLLSAEAYARFRRTLGKLLWLAQSRHDLKVWLSLIGTQQSSPKHGTELALRSVLRFLYSDRNVHLMLPSAEYDSLSFPERSRMNQFLHSFADASFAPYRFNSRRGISGGVVFCEGGLVRSFARQQQALSLSSCEAELYALQMVTQESVSFSKFCHRMLFAMGEMSEPETVEIMLESDSSSALQLIQALDLPKKSRHVEIRLLWIRGQLEAGKVKIRHRPGVENVADLFTKCLPSKDFMRHRATLGFVSMEAPLNDLLTLSMSPDNRKLAVIELCCKAGSMIQKACETSQLRYCGVTKDVEMKSVVLKVKRFIEEQRLLGNWIHMHVSTPCTSGSPLKNFSGNVETQADVEWKGIMDAVPKYLEGNHKPDAVSFELPRSNSIWDRPETQHVLNVGNLDFQQDVHLCQARYKGKDGKLIGKVMRFKSTHAQFCKSLGGRFGTCHCTEHSPLDQVGWSDTGFYNKTLARAILNGAKANFQRK